jgi:hypothetical protein
MRGADLERMWIEEQATATANAGPSTALLTMVL